LTRTTAFPPVARRTAFVAAGLAGALAMALPAIVGSALAGSVQPLLLAAATGVSAALAAALLGAWTRSAFAPRLVLLIAWYGYLSAA
jgi:hypothetical protein